MRERINADFISAFKAKNDLGKRTLSLLKNAIQSEEKIKGNLTDDEVIGIIQKQVKQREQSVDAFKKANSIQLMQNELNEIEVLKVYLPAPLTKDELIVIINKIKENVGNNIHEGKLIGLVNKEVKGRNSVAEIKEVISSL
jgi:uncharacterized protein YqeY